MILINTQNIKQNLNQRVGLYNPQELVEILLTLPWKNPALQQAVALGVCLYCSRQRVKEYSLVAQPGNAACKANRAAQGREEGWGEAKNGGWAGTERPAPLPPWRGALGHCLPGEQLGMCPLRFTHGQQQLICPPAVTLLSSQSQVPSGQHRWPLARECVFEDCKAVSTCRIHLCLSSSFFSILESKRQACTYLFCTL